MVLPEPLLSGDDIIVARKAVYNLSSLISHPWSKDRAKFAVIRAVAPCLARFGHGSFFDANIAGALTQEPVCFLHSYSLEVEEMHYSTLLGWVFPQYYRPLPVLISWFIVVTC